MLPRAAGVLRSTSWFSSSLVGVAAAPHLSAGAQCHANTPDQYFMNHTVPTSAVEISYRNVRALISDVDSGCSWHHHARRSTAALLPYGFAWNLASTRRFSGSALTTLQQKTSISATARALLVDTLDMVRNLEKVGLTRQQAEALTVHLTEVLCTHKEKLSQDFVSMTMLEKTLLEQDAQQAGFKSEIFKAQDMHVTALNRESERLSNAVLKVRSDIKYEVDKLTASQRLDLNLEKGRMRDELQALRDKSNDLEIQIDKEINALKAAVELTKNETIKYSLGLMFGLLTIGLGVVRLLV